MAATRDTETTKRQMSAVAGSLIDDSTHDVHETNSHPLSYEIARLGRTSQFEHHSGDQGRQGVGEYLVTIFEGQHVTGSGRGRDLTDLCCITIPAGPQWVMTFLERSFDSSFHLNEEQ
jgi:hypothetical protein